MNSLTRIARAPFGTPVAVSLTVAAALFAGGCDDSPTSLDQATPGELVLDVDQVHLESLQETFSVQARVFDLEGREMTNVPLSWTLEAPGVVESVGASNFRSVGNGATTIHVAVADEYPHVGPDGYRSGMLRGSVGVTVQQRPVALALGTSESPGPGQAVVHLWSLGQAADLFGWTVDAMGNPVSGVMGGVVWNSANSLVSQVGPGGQVVATGNGNTMIHAGAAGMTGSVAVEVHAALDLTACATVSGTQGGCGQESLTFAEEGY